MLSSGEKETIKIAQNIAADLKGNEIICLRGDLGAGKTVFARGLIRALTRDPGLEVPSPTFTLIQTYASDKGPLWHFDLYRLEDPEEIYELGWEEALAEGIVLIEWPERLESYMPRNYIDIHIAAVKDKPEERRVEISQVRS